MSKTKRYLIYREQRNREKYKLLTFLKPELEKVYNFSSKMTF